ncbi:MAG: DUF6531 domain-containing protein, partial [Pseudomonadales bacterium]
MDNRTYRTIFWTIVTLIAGSDAAAISCDSSNSIQNVIGVEYVAQQGPDGSGRYRFDFQSVECKNNEVNYSLFYFPVDAGWHHPDTLHTTLTDGGTDTNHRSFVNSCGTRLIAIHKNYTGLINGQSYALASYPYPATSPGYYNDSFPQPFYLTYGGGIENCVPPPSYAGPAINNDAGESVKMCLAKPNGGLRDPLSTLGGSPLAADPINVATGNVYISESDFDGIAGLLRFDRYYNSASDEEREMGLGWRHSYERAIHHNGDDLVVERHDGKVVAFTEAATGKWESDAFGQGWVESSSSPSAYKLIFSDGGFETYDDQGQLTGITEASGESVELSYPNGALIVSDSFGNSVTLTYSNGLLSTLTLPDNSTISYAYTGNVLDTLTYSDTSSREFHYADTNAPTRLSGITDERGVRINSWTYDSLERAISSAHAAVGGSDQDVYLLDYSIAGQTTLTNPLGKETIYHYSLVSGVNKASQLEGLNSPSGSCPAANKNFTYYGDGLLNTRTDWRGNVTKYEYQTNGQQQKRTLAFASPEAYEISTSWDSVHPTKPDIITVPGKTTDSDYNATGQLTSLAQIDTTIHSSGRRTTRYTYTTEGRVDTIDGPRLNVSDIYDLDYNSTTGLLESITNPLNHVIEIVSYNGRGQPTAIKDANLVTTTLTYTQRGDRSLLRTSATAGKSTTYDYDAAGQLTNIILSSGATISYEYDEASRLSAITNNLNERVDYSLDEMGNITATSIMDGSSWVHYNSNANFDELGRISSALNFNSEGNAYQYDADSNLTVTTENNGQQIVKVIDALGRIDTITDQNNGIIDLAYDVTGAQDSVTDQRNLNTSYQYDGLGSLMSMTSPDTGTTTYLYDAAGNRTQQIDARGVIVNYTYDALNRLTLVDYPTDNDNVGYGYDDASNGNHGVGRLTSINRPGQNSSVSYFYDAHGNATSVAQTLGTDTYTLGLTYDGDNQLKETIYPAGRIVTYGRNSAGQIISVTTKENASASIENVASNINYRPFGPVTNYTLGNGISITRSYDQAYRLSDMIDETSDGDVLVDKTLQYYSTGELGYLNDNLDNNNSLYYSYDNQHRVITETGPHGTIDYDYDAVGNRTLRDIDTLDDNAEPVTITEIYSPKLDSNQLDSVAITTTQIQSPAPDVAKAYSYDETGRLIEFRRNGSLMGTYKHNGLGQRISKTANDSTTHFNYDLNGELISEHRYLNDGSQLIVDYIWLEGRPLVQLERLLVAGNTPPTPTTTWLHSDHLNTPRIGTDSTEQIVWLWQSDAFGEITAETDVDNDGITHDVNLRFPGQYADVESGLYYNYFRDYDP